MELRKDTVVAVTGASRGIGEGIARAFAERGVRVAITARSEDRLKLVHNGLVDAGAADVFVKPGDVSNSDFPPQFIQAILDRWQRIDILVNNAGLGVMKPVTELTDDDFDRTLAVNLAAPFRLAREVIPVMKRQGGGHIVNISSIAGETGFEKGGAYSASKFGLNGFSECLMQEVRRDAIKVTVICPGSVATGFDTGGGDNRREDRWKLTPAEIGRTVVYAVESPDHMMTTKLHLRPTLHNKPS